MSRYVQSILKTDWNISVGWNYILIWHFRNEFNDNREIMPIVRLHYDFGRCNEVLEKLRNDTVIVIGHLEWGKVETQSYCLFKQVIPIYVFDTKLTEWSDLNVE